MFQFNMTDEQKELIQKGIIGEMTREGFAVWMVIQSYGGETAFPSQNKIAELCGVNRKTVSKALELLEDNNFIERRVVREGRKKVTYYGTTRKFGTAKDFLLEFKELYQQKYGVEFNPSWGRDAQLVKTKLLQFTDEQLDYILQHTFREYEKQYANRNFPRPTIGAVCSFIANKALAEMDAEEQRKKKIAEAEQEDLDKYLKQEF